MAFVIISLMILLSVTGVFYVLSITDSAFSYEPTKRELDYYKAQFLELEATLNELENADKKFKALFHIKDGPKITKIDQQVIELQQQIDLLNSQIKNLYSVIDQDPLKAVSLPLIKKDVQILINSHQKDTSMLQREVSRVYDLYKWLFGILFTIILSIAGIVWNSMRAAKEEERNSSAN